MKAKKPLMQWVNVRVDDNQYQYLLDRARLLGSESISVALRAVLAESMREHGNGKQQSEEQAA